MVVQPLYSLSDIQKIQTIIGKKWGNVREAEAFFMSCHIGLRACDLLDLKFDQFKKKRFYIKEKKTQKNREIIQTDVIVKTIDTLRVWYRDKGIDPVYVFQSTSSNSGKKIRPVSQQNLYAKINEATEALGIDGNFGTHTGRKTFGYHLYKKTGNLAIVQLFLNHSDPEDTLKYIGITKHIADEAIMSLDFSLPCED